MYYEDDGIRECHQEIRRLRGVVREQYEELQTLREENEKLKNETTTNLYDLIVYSREDGETIAKYSAEHLTRFALKEGKLIICSNQLEKTDEYMAGEVGFCFQGR